MTPAQSTTTETRNFSVKACEGITNKTLSFDGEVTALTTLSQKFSGPANSKSYRAFFQGNVVVINCGAVGGCGTCTGSLLVTYNS